MFASNIMHENVQPQKNRASNIVCQFEVHYNVMITIDTIVFACILNKLEYFESIIDTCDRILNFSLSRY